MTEGASAEPKKAKWFKLEHDDEMEYDLINGMPHDALEDRLGRDIENNEEEHKLIKMPKWCPCRCCRSKKEKEQVASFAITFRPSLRVIFSTFATSSSIHQHQQIDDHCL